MKRPIVDINLYAYGNAAKNYDCEQGALVLKQAFEKTDFSAHCYFHSPLQVHHRKQQYDAIPDVAMLNASLATTVKEAVSRNRFFITVGGDHSAAIGSWSGAASVKKNIGLIWFDAHMDSHTFQTTPSQNIHGMPLAVLLGYGEKTLTHILSDQPKLKPENVVLIGVRSFEKGEAALLKKLKVKIFYMDDIKKLGMYAVLQESVNLVTKNTDAFGISIDLDGFDPEDAPGVGSPEKNGVRAKDFLSAFSVIAKHPKLIGADITEFNPVLDCEKKTEKLGVELFCALGTA